jgi:hypothetical protein
VTLTSACVERKIVQTGHFGASGWLWYVLAGPAGLGSGESMQVRLCVTRYVEFEATCLFRQAEPSEPDLRLHQCRLMR